MLGEEVEVECVGVIPVDAASFFEREVGEVAVVGVHVDERDGEGGERVGDFSATVDFPLPEPPAMPMMRGLDTRGI